MWFPKSYASLVQWTFIGESFPVPHLAYNGNLGGELGSDVNFEEIALCPA